MKLAKYLLVIALVIMLAFALTACESAVEDEPAPPTTVEEPAVDNTPDPTQGADLHDPGVSVTDWNVALNYLKEGNERYIRNQTINRDAFASDRNIIKDGQKPFASILSCADSRVAPELYFDQKPGDIFIVRNAGNIADTTAVGSFEFSVAALEVPLIVVVGHSACGAVKGALGDGGYPAPLQSILDFIAPNVAGYTLDDLDAATTDNVKAQMEILKNDEVIKGAGITVVGAIYDIGTGKITWL